MVKSLHFFNGGGSTSQARPQHFIEVWPEFAPQGKKALPNLKPSIALIAYPKYQDQYRLG